MINVAIHGGASWVWPVIDAVGLNAICPSNTPELLFGLAADWPCPERLFFLNWSYRVPDIVLGHFVCVNFHAAPLPMGRGGGPLENMIRLGHTTTVITAHRMTREMDAGPVYAVSEPISLAGTKDDITARFVEPVSALIRTIIETNPEPHPQVGEPVYFKRLPPDEYRAFWSARG